MALKIKSFELPNGFILDEAYLKVHVVKSCKVDYEKLEVIPDSDDLLTTWISRLESSAMVYIYADQIARKNQVQPMEWFEYNFDYDITGVKNIFEQAYSKLKELYPISEDC